MSYRIIGLAFLAVALSSCGETHKDYDSSAKCQEMGYTAGTKEYEKCMSDEKSSRMLEEQEKEFDQMKQQQQDWTVRRY